MPAVIGCPDVVSLRLRDAAPLPAPRTGSRPAWAMLTRLVSCT